MFLQHCCTDSKALDFLKNDQTAEVFAGKYLKGVQGQHKQLGDHQTFTVFSYWANARRIAFLDTPQLNDFKDVAKVIHGHAWVAYMRSNTPALIKKMTDPGLKTWCPELCSLLSKLLAPRE